MRASGQPEQRQPVRQFQQLLTPYFVFALVAAVVCWIAAWVFRDTIELLFTLAGVGCLLIVAAVCAYLYLLVSNVEREG